MNAAALMPTCPTEETLSAFIDQRLDAKARLDVVAHLAECADCRDVVVAAGELQRLEPATGGEVVRGRPAWPAFAPLAAAAAILVVLFGVTPIREKLLGKRGIPTLVEAASGLPERTTEARMSAAFAYRDYSPDRGGSGTPAKSLQTAEYEVLAAAADVEERLEKKETPANLHAAGVARILSRKATEAVAALEAATRANPESAALLTDLSAAYLARGHSGDDLRALDAANRSLAIERTPAALWNRALALRNLQRDAEARDAWNDYLAVDATSQWAEEVRNEQLPLLE
jgi:hypothetical protein